MYQVNGIIRIPGCGIRMDLSRSKVVNIVRQHLLREMPGVVIIIKHIGNISSTPFPYDKKQQVQPSLVLK